MKRTQAREIAMRLCFELSSKNCSAQDVIDSFFEKEHYETLASEDDVFSAFPDKGQLEYIKVLVNGIGEHSAELDGYIEKYLRGWQFGRISRTALAIIKTAMYEILYMPDIPNGAAINEAVEISKKYDSPETVSFINGVLGSFVREEIKEP